VAGAIEHDLGRTELLAAVDQCHLAAEPRQEIGLFHGGVTAPDHHDFPLAVEEAVTSGAGADAVADKLLLRFQPQPARRSSRSDDDGPRFDPLAFQVEAERLRGEIGVEHGPVQIFGAEILRLLPHVFDQVRAVDALWKARKVFHQRS